MDKTTQQEFEKLGRMVKRGFDAVDKRFDAVDTRFERVESRLDRVEKKVNTLPDKDYLTAKLADLKGDLVVLARKQDEKTNLLIEMLARKKVLGSSEVDALRAIEVFPVPRTAPSSA